MNRNARDKNKVYKLMCMYGGAEFQHAPKTERECKNPIEFRSYSVPTGKWKAFRALRCVVSYVKTLKNGWEMGKRKYEKKLRAELRNDDDEWRNASKLMKTTEMKVGATKWALSYRRTTNCYNLNQFALMFMCVRARCCCLCACECVC